MPTDQYVTVQPSFSFSDVKSFTNEVAYSEPKKTALSSTELHGYIFCLLEVSVFSTCWGSCPMISFTDCSATSGFATPKKFKPVRL